MPRGISRYDEAQFQQRLFVPNGVGGVGRIDSIYAGDATFPKTFGNNPLNRSVAGRHYVESTSGQQFNRTVIAIVGLTNGVSYNLKFTIATGTASAGFVRVGTDSGGGGTGVVYSSGAISPGTVSTTFTTATTAYFLSLFSNQTTGIMTFEGVSVCLTSGSAREQSLLEGYFNWQLGGWNGLAGTHQFKNRPPLIGD